MVTFGFAQAFKCVRLDFIDVGLDLLFDLGIDSVFVHLGLLGLLFLHLFSHCLLLGYVRRHLLVLFFRLLLCLDRVLLADFDAIEELFECFQIALDLLEI